MGNLLNSPKKEIEMVAYEIGTCGLCETTNIPMEPGGLFCRYCYDFYFRD